MMDTSSMSNNTHIVFSAFPAWGHVRPFCILAARLVRENENVVVTMIIVPPFLKKAQAEISAEFRDAVKDSTRSRLRVLSSFKLDTEDPFALMGPLVESYGVFYQALVQGKPVTCAVTGTVFDAVSPPNIGILDFFAHPMMLTMRAISGRSVPIISWVTGHMGTCIRFWGPERLGGFGDIGKKVEEEVARTGATIKEVEGKLFNFAKSSTGSVVRIPGVPDMYDWEFFPQTVSAETCGGGINVTRQTHQLAFDMPLAEIMKLARAGLTAGDAVFLTSSYNLEGETLEAAKSWFKEWNQDVYVIGPLLPVGYGVVQQSDRGSPETREFLDNALLKYGEKSVTLISFGTVFWPAAQDYIEEVLGAYVEKKSPFIICYASPFAKMSEDLINRVKDSGLGLISRWIPQQYVLSHKATGWFMTHGGQNSVLESLGSGVPMICWPFEADQPATAAVLSMKLKVAFELIEVRTGDSGLKPLRRFGRAPKGTKEVVGGEIREIIDSCRGEKGRLLGKNAEAIKAEFAKAWEADGRSRDEFRKFSRKYDLHLSYR